MNVSHIESSSFPGQPARTQSAQPPFVGDFRKRVGLVHELRELAAAEKFVDHCSHRFGVDDIVEHHRLGLLQAHPLLDGPFHAHQTDAELVFQQFAHTPNAPVAEMIDVVDGAFHPFLQLEQIIDRAKDVLSGEYGIFQGLIES